MASIDTKEISPTLREIIDLFDEDNRRLTDANLAAESSEIIDETCEGNKDFLGGKQNGSEEGENMFDSNPNEFEDNAAGDYAPWGCDHDELGSVVDECSSYIDTNFAVEPEVLPHHSVIRLVRLCIFISFQENNSSSLQEQHADTSVESIAGFLAHGLGIASSTNAWAGPDHWKYRKIKGRTVPILWASIFFFPAFI